MATEGDVAILPDSTGKNIRTLQVTTYISGTPTTVHMQVLALADEAGNPIAFGEQTDLLRGLLAESRLHTEILLKLANAAEADTWTRQDFEDLVDEARPEPLEN